jgi:hypothetical protein
MSRSNLRIPEAYRNWAKAARKAGWTITATPSGHLLWTSPDGARVRTASTPGCHSAATDIVRAKLRRAGLKEAA